MRLLNACLLLPILAAFSVARAGQLQDFVPPVIAIGPLTPTLPAPPVSYAEVAPSDTVKVSFTTLHSSHRNWLQIQLTPVGACQEVVVDSIKVAELDDADTGFSVQHMGAAKRRDARIWWRLVQPDTSGNSYCSQSNAYRLMREVAAPRKRPGTDSLLTQWALRRIEAIGPGMHRDTALAEMVDQTTWVNGGICPNYNIIFVPPEPETLTVAQIADSLSRRIKEGLPLVRIGKTSYNQGVFESIDASLLPSSLGSSSSWASGLRGWKEVMRAQTLKSWGATAPAYWFRSTGRFRAQWRNEPGACCESCDTVCDRYPGGVNVSTAGVDVVWGNDSSQACWKNFDDGLVNQLAQSDWLALPDTQEMRQGNFTKTFFDLNNGRVRNAFAIVNDSVNWNGVMVPLALIESSLEIPLVQRSAKVQVTSTTAGLRLRASLGEGESFHVRVRSISGRLLTESVMSSSSHLVPLSGHGICFVEVRNARTATVLRVVH